MANDKDFKIKNGIQSDVYYESVGTVTLGSGTASLDLNTGSVFELTPTEDVTVSLTNPAASGTVGGATLLLVGSAVYPYDLASAVYDGVSFSVAGQEGSALGVFFKPDGTKMYITGSVSDAVHEYNLSTAWDVSTSSFLQSFSVSTEETAPQGLFFKPDGTKMYIVGSSGDDINEYDLSTAWNVSTAVYLQVFSVSAQDTAPVGVSFKPDGLKMYVAGAVGADVNEYDLSTAWDISTSSFLQSFSVTNPTDLFFKPDGLRMYIYDTTNEAVREYTLSTAWNISTSVFLQSFSVAAQGAFGQAIFFKADGTKMYTVESSTDTIYQYSTAAPATITYGPTLEWSGGTAPTAPAIGETDVVTFNTRDGGSTYQGVLAIDGAK